MRIFKMTTPLSKYLQTSGMDNQKAHLKVKCALNKLRILKTDDAGLKKIVDDFIEVSNIKLDNHNNEDDILNFLLKQVCL